MYRSIFKAAVAAAMVLGGSDAWAADAIEGRYLQNRACRGDASDPARLKVLITPQQITYSGGVCAIRSRRKEGNRLVFDVSCRFRGGNTMGSEIAFTPLRGGAWHMSQGDGEFDADIYPCPD